MSATIDKRIVEMAFENSEFEKNVSGSIGSIDKLKRALNFSEAGKSFDQINSSASRVNLSAMSEGIGKISSGFSAMGIVAITTLANIVNSAYQAGSRIVKALTIDPIKAGLDEYETKLNSVQTILANTQKEGTNLETVTNALNILNEYSDKTIYNFQEMTRNIGTFTAAGVKLDDSVAAIKGIANLAAISGSNSQQASTAMYQLSQALSTGTVRLMDWNSVVNAGMGGQVFQDAIKETARAHGVAIDDIIAAEGSFRDSLQKGWFTSEILTETLAKFTGDLTEDQLKMMGYTEEQIAGIIKMGQTANDAATKVKTFSQLFSTLKEAAQSGWAQTWEIIIGNFDEAKQFLTDLNNYFGGVLGSMADARNSLLSGWKDLGGRTALLESLKNVINAIVSLINPIKQAFQDIFPPTTAQQLFNITKGLETFTKSLIIGGETSETIKNIFKGVFAIFDIGKMAVFAIAKEFQRLVGFLAPVPGGIGSILTKVSEFIQRLRDSIKANNVFEKVMKTIGDTILLVAGFVQKGIAAIVQAVNKFKELNKSEGFLKSFIEAIGSFFSFFKNIDFGFISDFVDRLRERFKPLVAIGNFIGKAFSKLLEVTKPIRDILGKVFTTIKEALKEIFDGIIKSISNADFSNFDFNAVFDGLNSGLLAALLLSITQFVRKGSGLFGGILDIFKSVSGFADGASGILGGINLVLNGVKDTFTAYQQQIKAGILLKIAGAIGILAASLLVLSLIDSKKLTGALAAITGLFANLLGSLALYEKTSGVTGIPAMASGVAAMIGLATSVVLLTGALAILASIPTDGLIKGVTAIAALSGILVTTSIALTKNGAGVIKGALSMVVFSLALRTLIKPLQILADMDPKAMANALAGLGVLLLELGVFMKTMDFKGTAIDDMLAIFILGLAISDLSDVIVTFGSIDTASMIQGLAVMGLIFGALVAFTKASSGGLQFVYTAAGMLVLSGAMVILAEVLKTLGSMSWEELAIGLTGLGGALLILGVAMTAMSGGIAGAAAILVAAVALAILAPSLAALGKMNIEQVGIALLALAGVFVIFGLAGYLLTPMVPTLILLGGAILLFGVAILAAGVGVGLFVGALALLATVGAAAGASIGAILLAVSSMLPLLAAGLALGIITFAKIIKNGAPILFDAGKTLLLGFIGSITETIPQIIDMILTGVDTLLLKLSEKLPSIISSGYSILLAFLEGLSSNIDNIVIVVSTIITNFLTAMSSELPKIVDSGWKFIIAWIDAMKASVTENLPTLITAVQELGIEIVKGLVAGLLDARENAVQAIIDLAKMVIDSFKKTLGIHSPSDVFIKLAFDIIRGLVNGIKQKINLVSSEAKTIASTFIQSVKEKYNDMISLGKDLVIGFANGIREYISEAITAASELGTAVLTTIANVLDSNSPSKETFNLGKFADQGLAGGIKKYAKLVVDSAEDLGNDTVDSFSNSISQIAKRMEEKLDTQPTITPILDLTDLKNADQLLNGIFGKENINLSLAALKASSISVPTELESNSLTKDNGQPTISYTQINNSPKALSAKDIYRQTKNQISRAKKLVGGNA